MTIRGHEFQLGDLVQFKDTFFPDASTPLGIITRERGASSPAPEDAFFAVNTGGVDVFTCEKGRQMNISPIALRLVSQARPVP